MYCSKCGIELSNGTKFCHQCGSPVISTIESETKSNGPSKGLVGLLKSKKVVAIGAIILCVVILFAIKIGTTKSVEEKPTEEHLLGKWIAENYNGESTIIFEQSGDKYVGEWTVYDYYDKEWDTLSFTIKEIDGYVMTILIDNGEMEYVPFAVSKDTLIFADTEYKNEDKDVPISTDKYTYILDGIIRPVTMNCYFGMSNEEASKIIPYTLKDYGYENIKEYYCILPEDKYGHIKLVLAFDDEYGLDEITYWLDDEHYNIKSGLIDFLSDLYGDYTKEQWSTYENYYSYIWHSGNLVIRLNEDTEDDTLWIDYCIDTDWYLEFRRNNKD